MSLNLKQDYANNQSGGIVTEPVNSSYVQAYAEFLGITEPVNLSWIQAICANFGILEPLYGSYLIALANYYGITEPVNGSWWYALSIAGPPIPTVIIWNLVATEWQDETTPWATGGIPNAPTYTGPFSFEDSNPVLFGAADSNNFVTTVINGETYLTQADGSGNWTQQVGPLVGGPGQGTLYQMGLTGKDSATGLESQQTLREIYIIENTVLITFELRTTWSLYWYFSGIQVEKEVTPGVFVAVEYEGNPTWNNGAEFYKVKPFAAGNNVPAGYSAVNILSFCPGDESGANDTQPVFRDLVLDLGFNYRIVGVTNVGSNPNYARFSRYTVLNGTTIILPQYAGQDVDYNTGNVQQTFTL